MPQARAPRSRTCRDASLGGLLIPIARLRRRRRPDARARRRGAPPRRAAHRARPRAADLSARRRHRCRDRSRIADRQRRGARRRQLVAARSRSTASTTRVPVRPVRGQLLQLGVDGPAAAARRSGASAAISCRGRTGRCSSARRWRTRGSTSGRRWPACGICSTPPASSCRTRGRRGSSRRGSDCGRRAPTSCRSSARRSVLPNLMYATGHYRNGVLLAPLTAQLVADAMLEGKADPILDVTSPRRFGL